VNGTENDLALGTADKNGNGVLALRRIGAELSPMPAVEITDWKSSEFVLKTPRTVDRSPHQDTALLHGYNYGLS